VWVLTWVCRILVNVSLAAARNKILMCCYNSQHIIYSMNYFLQWIIFHIRFYNYVYKTKNERVCIKIHLQKSTTPHLCSHTFLLTLDYLICTVRYIRIKINHGDRNVLWVLTWVCRILVNVSLAAARNRREMVIYVYDCWQCHTQFMWYHSGIGHSHLRNFQIQVFTHKLKCRE
jgi:hypothetical protein